MNYKVLLLGVAVVAVTAFVAYTTINPSSNSASDMSQQREVMQTEDVSMDEAGAMDKEVAASPILSEEETQEYTEEVLYESAVEAPSVVVPEVSNPMPEVATPAPEPVNTTPEYTLAEVAMHGTENDCWTAVNGQVYDITNFIAKHPGGKSNIMRICGIDGTKAFEGQHGGSAGAKTTLAGFEIGVLK